MKIIGRGVGGRVILEASGDEVANIMGYVMVYAIQGPARDLEAGTEIPVAKYYEAMANTRQNPRALRDIEKNLREAANTVAKIGATFNAVSVDAVTLE